MQKYIDNKAQAMAFAGKHELASLLEFGHCTIEAMAEIVGIENISAFDHVVIELPGGNTLLFENHQGLYFDKLETGLPAWSGGYVHLLA